MAHAAKSKEVVVAVSLALAAASAWAGEPTRDVRIGTKLGLRSTALNEDRPYWVHLPASYDDQTFAPQRYPVLYLLDGDAHFHSVTGVVQFMSTGINQNLQVPEMIVVAIPNTDRTRDFTPTHSIVNYEGKEVPYLQASGGGGAFLTFLEHELFPRIESTYRTLPYRILVGHSLGGLFALHAVIDAPQAFNAAIAIDPSAWWDGELLLRRAQGRLKDARRYRAAVYVSMANTPGFEPGDPRVDGATRRLARLLQSAPGVRCTVQYFEGETHGSVPLLSLYHGLSYVFDGYKVQVDADRQEPSDLAAHFERQSERLGVKLLPPEATVNGMGYYLLHQARNVDKAIAYFALNVANHPASWNAYASLAEAYRAKGEKALAILNYQRSLRRNPANESAKRRLRELAGPAEPER
jgi:predicted alpha/beta superfamily hydrolase